MPSVEPVIRIVFRIIVSVNQPADIRYLHDFLVTQAFRCRFDIQFSVVQAACLLSRIPTGWQPVLRIINDHFAHRFSAFQPSVRLPRFFERKPFFIEHRFQPAGFSDLGQIT